MLPALEAFQVLVPASAASGIASASVAFEAAFAFAASAAAAFEAAFAFVAFAVPVKPVEQSLPDYLQQREMDIAYHHLHYATE